MTHDEELLQQLLANFREELGERLAAINTDLLALEQDPDTGRQAKLIEDLFRHIHSLKGGARTAGLQPIEELAHGIEDVFGAAKRGRIQLTTELFDLLYQGLDLIGAAMAGMSTSQGLDPALDLPGYLVRLAESWRGQPVLPPQIAMNAVSEPASREEPRPIQPSAWQGWDGETIRVPTARLDELMAQTGELLVTRLRARQQVEEIKQLYDVAGRRLQSWQEMREVMLPLLQQAGNGTGAQACAFLYDHEEQLRQQATWLSELIRRFSDDAASLSQVTAKLQDGVRRTRMLPLATLLPTFRRIVRDLARERGREVNLQIMGADTEMDKHVLEQLKDPLMHLLRNAIDHGVEDPAARVAQGKPAQGTVRLSAERQGHSIVIEVADDGGGIDIETVRSTAVRRGLLSPEEAAGLDADEVTRLLFAPGFSTAPILTEISGRGVGLDVVRKNVEAIHGRVELRSTPGKGTTVTLSMPFTLVSTHCLLLRAAGQVYALPIASIERLVTVAPRDIALVEGCQSIPYRGHVISLVPLSHILGGTAVESASSEQGMVPAIVLSSSGRRVAFPVDELLSEEELVVKGLDRPLGRVPNVSGATVLGTGQVVIVLNAADLVKSAQGAAGRRQLPVVKPKEVQQRTVLVVDDSVTTRTLEMNILTTAGYEVKLAIDGETALAALADNHCDLVVADIAMPRMDGFELTERIRNDERYRDLPVVLVTSLDSAEHKARGIAVGADAYIMKSAFDQDSLLETIRQLL